MKSWRDSTTPAQRRDYNSKHRKLVREFVINSKKGKPCAICGGFFNTWQMQYDHLDHTTKKEKCSRFYSAKAAQREMAKCRLLCANCHANVSYENRFVYQNIQKPKKVGTQLDLIKA